MRKYLQSSNFFPSTKSTTVYSFTLQASTPDNNVTHSIKEERGDDFRRNGISLGLRGASGPTLIISLYQVKKLNIAKQRDVGETSFSQMHSFVSLFDFLSSNEKSQSVSAFRRIQWRDGRLEYDALSCSHSLIKVEEERVDDEFMIFVITIERLLCWKMNVIHPHFYPLVYICFHRSISTENSFNGNATNGMVRSICIHCHLFIMCLIECIWKLCAQSCNRVN